MSFSQDVKKEIMDGISGGGHAALLCGMILSSGSLVISGKGLSFTIASESRQFVDFSRERILAEYPSAQLGEREENINFKQKSRIELSVDPASGRQILTDLGILSFGKDNSFVISRIGQKHLTIEQEGKIELLKGMFLGSGSVSIPEHVDVKDISNNLKSSGYHLEWSVQSKEQADYIAEILAEMGEICGIAKRNESFVVYVKEADSISSIIGTMGAFKSVLNLENERAGRQMRNLVNRQANCISANIDKSITSALATLDAIEKIRQTIGIEALSQPLQDAAYARLENPEGSLNDILEQLPYKISKGALSQRFKKIIAISKEV